MKRILLFIIAMPVIAAIAIAAPCGPPPVAGPPPSGSGTVGTSPNIGVSGSNGFSCTIGGLTFENFIVLGASGIPPFQVDLVDASTAPAGGGTTSVFLTFNPNLGNAEMPEDIYFYFTVRGGVTQIDLSGVSLPGSGTSQPSIGEVACASPIPMPGEAGANLCPEGTQRAALTVFAGAAGQSSSTFTNTSPLYIFKDIQTPAGTVMSSFTQSFTTTQAPEPISLILMGSGLLGLGILRRVRKG